VPASDGGYWCELTQSSCTHYQLITDQFGYDLGAFGELASLLPGGEIYDAMRCTDDFDALTCASAIPAGGRAFKGAKLARLASSAERSAEAATAIRGTNFVIVGTRKINQIASRGWSTRLIENTVNAPYTTRVATNKATGGVATAYYRESGAYVILDDTTRQVVQLSDRFNPEGWIPDDSIITPYIPSQ
jgi:hypothetical protein